MVEFEEKNTYLTPYLVSIDPIFGFGMHFRSTNIFSQYIFIYK